MRRVRAAVLSAAACGLLLLGCNRSDLAFERIVLVTIDTLRADHLGCYGYPRETSPFLDRLAARGVLFENLFTAMATTVPSHASIFTSLYPLQHGVTKNGHRLADELSTMAEILRDLGYATGGFVSTHTHFKAANVDQGYDAFSEPDLGTKSYRPAEATLQAAQSWIESVAATDRFFIWLHLFDPHEPLVPPQAHAQALTRTSDRQGLMDFWLRQQHLELAPFGGDRDVLFRRITDYDAEIRYVDEQLERFHQHMTEHFGDDGTLWMITSDHGEGTGSHSWWGHGKYIYNEQLRTPLIIQSTDLPWRGLRIGAIAESVDLLPTLLELLGGSPQPRNDFEGESLLPLFLQSVGQGENKRRAFSQRRDYEPGGSPPHRRASRLDNYEEGRTFALQSEDFKYILHTRGAVELFDLRSDPGEIHNLAGRGLDEERRLHAALLDKVLSLESAARMQPQNVDHQAIERLRSLGYIQ